MDLTKLNFDANEMLDGLQKWVLCESPSFDRTAVNRMQDIAAHDLALMGASVERITPHPLAGDCIRAQEGRARTCSQAHRVPAPAAWLP